MYNYNNNIKFTKIPIVSNDYSKRIKADGLADSEKLKLEFNKYIPHLYLFENFLKKHNIPLLGHSIWTIYKEFGRLFCNNPEFYILETSDYKHYSNKENYKILHEDYFLINNEIIQLIENSY